MDKIEIVRKDDIATNVFINGVRQERVLDGRMEWDAKRRRMVFVIRQESDHMHHGELSSIQATYDNFTLEYRTETIDDRMREAWGADVVGPIAPSDITQSLIEQLRERDAKGREKYGTSLDRKDLSASDWLQHQTEELLDAAGYAQAAKREAERLLAVEKAACDLLQALWVQQCTPEVKYHADILRQRLRP